MFLPTSLFLFPPTPPLPYLCIKLLPPRVLLLLQHFPHILHDEGAPWDGVHCEQTESLPPRARGRNLGALLPRELLVAAVAIGGGVGCDTVAGHALHVEGAVDAVGAAPTCAATTTPAANGFAGTQHDVVLVHDFGVAVDVDVVGDELPDSGAARAAAAAGAAAQGGGFGGGVAIVAQAGGPQLEGETGAGAGEGGGGVKGAGVKFGGGEGRVLVCEGGGKM